jgi:DNA-binding NtrC family response regulator
LEIISVASGRDALLTLRYRSSIELMLVPMRLPDVSLTALMSRVRALRPKQPWILVQREITVQEEIAARTLGALKLLTDVPSGEFLESLVASPASRARRAKTSSKLKLKPPRASCGATTSNPSP